MAVEEELTKEPAFYLKTGPQPEINRPPPPYRKPVNFGMDNYGMKHEVDENGNNNEGIMQWRFTAYL